MPLQACAQARPLFPEQPAALKPPYKLPEVGSVVVLRWDSIGGMMPTPPGQPEPALVLHANGRFSAKASAASAPRRGMGQLEPAALQALLAELLLTHGFASLDGAAIQAQLEAISQHTGRLFKVMDAGVTRITLTLPAVQHTVEMPALHAAVRLFPEVQALRQLHAVQQRLLALAQTAR